MPDRPGRHLIHRDTQLDILTGRLAGLAPREESGACTGMVASPVTIGICLGVIKTAEDLKIPSTLLQGLEGGREVELATEFCRPPVLHDDTIGYVGKTKPEGYGVTGTRLPRKRLEVRQGK